MKLAKGILVIAAGSLAVAGMATGEEATTATATKVAPMKQLLPDSYGKVEVRHELDRNMNGKKVTNDIPNVSVRPTLGSTFFDGDLNSSFTWIFQKNAGDAKVAKTTLYNVTTYNLISGTYGSITPYAEIYQDNGASFSSAYVGADFSTSKSFEMTFGKIGLSAYTLPLAEYTSAASKSTVTPANETGLDAAAYGLAKADAEPVEQRDPNLYSYTGISSSLKPAAVPGLSLSLGTELSRSWTPAYVEKIVDGEIRTSLDHYTVANSITNKYTVSYPINDKVSISNQVRQYIDGVYESRKEGKRWENRLSLKATLF